ncbi:hypothetical protein EVAR_69568_1 [Eumeta japonica]|uniref:Uncharacterized protein n=1 Tax=Eumeta variegata TaxID=151549 RepID=A0A4C1ZK74_EUMVA|nr:hypothetical protein EVAR_69568_1 [Eumeta japonica]
MNVTLILIVFYCNSVAYQQRLVRLNKTPSRMLYRRIAKSHKLYSTFLIIHDRRELPPPDNDANFGLQRYTILEKHWTILENVQHVQDLRRDMASPST